VWRTASSSHYCVGNGVVVPGGSINTCINACIDLSWLKSSMPSAHTYVSWSSALCSLQSVVPPARRYRFGLLSRDGSRQTLGHARTKASEARSMCKGLAA
jgi:hypothetical protein